MENLGRGSKVTSDNKLGKTLNYHQQLEVERSGWADLLDERTRGMPNTSPTLESSVPTIRQSVGSFSVSPSDARCWESYISWLFWWFTASLPVFLAGSYVDGCWNLIFLPCIQCLLH